MTNEERKVFWDMLCSFDGNNPREEAEKLFSTIKYPKYLFRYRPVSMNNLEALRTNHLYFSSANYYDDPFDTFLYIDIDRVKNELYEAFSNSEILEHMAERARVLTSKHEGYFSTEFVQMMTSPQGIQQLFFGGAGISFLEHLSALRNKVREDTWSVCFSENGTNETLWLKYANQHKGFSVIYDLENADNLLCGKQEHCKVCRFKDKLPTLYPVYYSDIPYDATDFSKTVLMHDAMTKVNAPIMQDLISPLSPAYWEREKTTLIKKECHHYDEEWRMIVWGGIEPPLMIEWIPHGVILGLRIGKNERELVISCAKQAGIKHVYESYINQKNQLDMREISQ